MIIAYHQDFNQFSLEKLKYKLLHSILVPSHQILLEEVDQRFAILTQAGITNLEELSQELSNKKKISYFSSQSGIPQIYLEVLIRHIGIYRPKPNLLAAFPGIDSSEIQLLHQANIKNSMQLLEKACSAKLRNELSALTTVPINSIYEIACLSDLSRAGYVGPIFARLLYEAGARNIKVLSTCQPDELYRQTVIINTQCGYYKGSFQVKDVAWCIEIAKELPIILEDEA